MPSAPAKPKLAPADDLKREVQAADSGLQPMQAKHRGKSHWWLVDREGRVKAARA